MRLPDSTPAELAEDPELAALELLGHGADVARRALIASYPELAPAGDFFVEEARVSARQCLAVALFSALDTLTDAIDHYRAHVDNCASRRGPISDDDIPF
jgi:hypothetical protein